jgi:PKD repeat protein
MKTTTTQKLLIALSLIAYLSSLISINAQNVAINSTGAPANPSAMLDVNSTSGGFLPPRMTTTQMNAIANPAEGLMVYNTTTKCVMVYTGGAWQVIYCACITAPTTPGTINTPCAGNSNVAYSIAALVGAASYTWTISSGNSITSGQGTAAITTNIINPFDTISVTASNSCGTSPASITYINVNSTAISTFTSPSSGIINDGIGFSPLNLGSVTYSWAFQNGSPSTSTAQYPFVTWSSAGTYTVSLTVTLSGCYSTTTHTITISNSPPCPHGSLGFFYTGALQTFTVPCSASSVTIQAYGAQGYSTSGGYGGYATGVLSVSPSQVLNIYVGGQGGSPTGGYNGGGNAANGSNGGPGPGGGGESDVRVGGTAYSNVVIVGGGGGGSGGYTAGCGGCGTIGTSGNNQYAGGGGGIGWNNGNGSNGGLAGGTGGTQTHGGGGGGGGYTSGGAGGCASGFSDCGTAGTQGVGGNANYAGGPYCSSSSGAGGGGYYGGGGGSSGNCGGSAGGGGSSVTIGLTNASFSGGIQTGNGEVIISW